MKTTWAFSALLINGAISAPSPIAQSEEPSKPLQCPESWYIDFLDFEGPGCPDHDPKFNRTGYSITSQGWGSDAYRGQCDTQWAWFHYPWMQASIGPGVPESKRSTWCEARVKYFEAADYPPATLPKEKSNWKIRWHKNGTSMEGEYGLDEGVTAEWKFTYLPLQGTVGENRVDTISVKGPVWNDTKVASRLDWSTTTNPVRHIATECGPTVFGMRIDLLLSSTDPNAKGTVISKRNWDKWVGVLQGLSFDWEQCQKS